MNWKLFWVILLCLPLLTGCGLGMLEREVYPLVMSVDTDADGRFTVGIQAPESLAEGAEPVYDVLTATGETPEEALALLRASTPFPLNFCQVRLCMVGYDLSARQELRPLLRWLLDLPAMRPDAQVMVALGRAQDVMESQKPDFGMRLSNHLNLLFERLGREELLPEAPLSVCVQRLADPLDDLLLGLCAVNENVKEAQQKNEQEEARPASAIPQNAQAGTLPRQGQNPVEYLGSAVVARGRVQGTLNARQTRLMLQTARLCQKRAAFHPEGLRLGLTLPAELQGDRQEIAQTLEALRQMGCDFLGFSSALSFRTDQEKESVDYRAWFALAQLKVE